MNHLFRHPNGKFGIALVSSNGNYIMGSNQGYERRSGCYKALKVLLEESIVDGGGASFLRYQDDTLKKPKVYCLWSDGKRLISGNKPVAPYIPNKK